MRYITLVYTLWGDSRYVPAFVLEHDNNKNAMNIMKIRGLTKHLPIVCIVFSGG